LHATILSNFYSVITYTKETITNKKQRQKRKNAGSSQSILVSFTSSKSLTQKYTDMKNFGGKYSKFDKIVARINYLTEEVVKKPQSESLKKQLRDAEEELCNLIQQEEHEVNKLVSALNEEPEWEE
jgi:hypothetical protein